MAMGLKYYPPSVPDVPRGLTAPTFRYLLYCTLVLVSLFAFLLLYVGLVAGAGYLVYLAITYQTPVSRGAVVLKVGAIACSVMLFLFLLKGLFKRHETDDSELTEISEAEQPDLYAFIRRLCREIGESKSLALRRKRDEQCHARSQHELYQRAFPGDDIKFEHGFHRA